MLQNHYTVDRLFLIDYNPPPQSQNNALQGALINAEYHIWVSVYFFLTSTWDKHFQWLHLTVVHWNIYTTNQSRNQNNISRVYIFHLNIHLTSVSNMFSYFQLDINYSFYPLKKSKLGCHVISFIINYGSIILHKYTDIIDSGIVWMTSIWRSITLLLHIKKPSWIK